MRKLIVSTLTLDGVMQAPGGPGEDDDGGFAHGGWSVHYWDEQMGQVMGEATSTPFALVLGRKTYDIFAAHWPHAPEEAGAKPFNDATKYVASRSHPRLEWRNSVLIEGDAAEGIAALKQEDGPELQVHGSVPAFPVSRDADHDGRSGAPGSGPAGGRGAGGWAGGVRPSDGRGPSALRSAARVPGPPAPRRPDAGRRPRAAMTKRRDIAGQRHAWRSPPDMSTVAVSPDHAGQVGQNGSGRPISTDPGRCWLSWGQAGTLRAWRDERPPCTWMTNCSRRLPSGRRGLDVHHVTSSKRRCVATLAWRLPFGASRLAVTSTRTRAWRLPTGSLTPIAPSAPRPCRCLATSSTPACSSQH
jgi:dihydrofolate reductase